MTQLPNGLNFGKTIIGSYKGFMNEKNQKYFFDLAQHFFSFRVVFKTTQKNHTSPNTGPIKKFLLQNINILTKLKKKYYKFQNRSQKKSQSCVPLMLYMSGYGTVPYLFYDLYLCDKYGA
jgi:hypothetical protein